MAITQANLRIGLLEDMGDYFSGTCTAEGTTGTIVDTAAKWLTANEKDAMWAIVLPVAGGRESRKINSDGFAPSTGIFTLSSILTTKTLENDPYQICQWTAEEIQRALNNAMRASGLRDVASDISLTWVVNTYSYTVPSAITSAEGDITRIEINSTPSTLWMSIRDYVVRDGTIYFVNQYTVGKVVKVWYEKDYTGLSSDTDSWEITEKQALLIYALAAIHLYKILWSRSSVDLKDDVKENIIYWQSEAMNRQKLYGQACSIELMRTTMP